MTSYVPAEWGDVAPSVTLETQLKDEVLEPGKSYEIRWSSWFIGTITVRACTGAFYVCLRRVRVFTIIGAVLSRACFRSVVRVRMQKGKY